MEKSSLVLLAAICRIPSYAAPQPAFEVVSIKPIGPIAIMIPSNGAPVKSPFMGPTYSPTRFTCRLTLKEMIREAYSIQSWQLNGPGWLSADIFEVSALMPENTSRDVARLMLRTMLADRFALSLHRERKEIPVYSLKIGTVPHRLEPARPSVPDELNRGSFTAGAISTQRLADFLTGAADRPVLDDTGLTEKYHVRLTWTLDVSQPGDRDPLVRRDRIFDAVRTQLGLSIVPHKAPFEILVIDRIERQPTPN